MRQRNYREAIVSHTASITNQGAVAQSLRKIAFDRLCVIVDGYGNIGFRWRNQCGYISV
jgi:hypothetical protein